VEEASGIAPFLNPDRHDSTVEAMRAKVSVLPLRERWI
jgi:hypothetical protein